MKRYTVLALLSLLFLVSLTGCRKKAPEPAQQVIRDIVIGTGSVTGVYYPTGGAISKMINQKMEEYGIRASVISTGGSVYNVNAVIDGLLDFGMIQSDIQYQACKGINDWEESGPQLSLRSVFSIHPESISLLAAVDSGISGIEDLRGKVVNIGNPGSGQRENAIDVLNLFGINWKTDINALEFKASDAAPMIQNGEIDAFFFTVGHPNASLLEATTGPRKTRFIPLEMNESLLRDRPYYVVSSIPVSLYPQVTNSLDVPSLGVKATLCTSEDVPDEIVYALTKEIFDNLEDFKKLHPAFSELTVENMLTGLTAPIHDGAMKYYKEANLR